MLVVVLVVENELVAMANVRTVMFIEITDLTVVAKLVVLELVMSVVRSVVMFYNYHSKYSPSENS